MKNLLLSLITALFLTVATGGVVSAFNPNEAACDIPSGSGQSTSVSTACDRDTDPILGSGGMLLRVVNIIAVIGGVAAVIVIIIAGFQFVLANGDSNKVTRARNTILIALAGLIVIAMSRVIVGFILSEL